MFECFYDKLIDKEHKLSVIGLGYVGLPLAVAFANKIKVIGYDNNIEKIELYKSGFDSTNEVGIDSIRSTTVEFTSDYSRIKDAKFHIIAVPTPVNADKTPDLDLVKQASALVGRNLTEGSIVVYESTVYPGVTEDICIPILEAESGLTCGMDFKVGYSPERINPGDKLHRLETITKVVSGMDKESLDIIAKVYETVITAGVHRANSIKVAEAAKVVENSQRDINIAFMNELAMVFDKMGIDTEDVLKAMGTKWNALGFSPGLVGGHCISVDPYYFIYQAEQLGYHSQIILSGRKINDGMGEYVADIIIKKLVQADLVVKKAKVVILGITFKEDCADMRNTKVGDIIKKLQEYGINPVFVDHYADKGIVKKEFGVDVIDLRDVDNADCLVFTVAHDEFKQLDIEQINKLYRKSSTNSKILIDVKSILDKKVLEANGFDFWRL